MSTTPRWDSGDRLGAALHTLRMTGIFYCRSELTAPWGLGMPGFAHCMWFHAVTAGACTIAGDGLPPLALAAGDLALVPHGRGHRVYGDPCAETPDVRDLPQEMLTPCYSQLRHGGGGAATTLVCGVVRLDHPTAADLVAQLPPVVRVRGEDAPHRAWMDDTLRFMAAEARTLRPGGDTILTRLADILVIQALRTWIETDPTARTGALGALADERLGAAMSAVLAQPGADWDVDGLARRAGMSRSAYAARFSAVVGEGPMEWVTRVRMQVALAALREGASHVGELAGRLGYRSEAAFSRAFKRVHGFPPGATRAT